MNINNYIVSTSEKNDMPAVHIVNWPVQNVLAFTTTRFPPVTHHASAILSATSSNDETCIDQAYSSFNLGLHVGDNSAKVNENRDVLLQFLQQKKHSAAFKQLTSDELADTVSNSHINIQWFDQVHGADVVEVNKYQPISITADAAITRDKNIALAIMTADCLPILLAADDGSEVAAIHGGWRPLSNSIIANTVNKMKTIPAKLCAWLGPCIGAESFEVGPEVREYFIQKNRLFTEAFKAVSYCRAEGIAEEKNFEQDNSPKQKYLANLHMIARIQLEQLGITHISALAHCTYQRQVEYYSYRRESKTGRMATLICCN